MTKINIAIDGYSGTGKSSTAKEVASRLGYTYLDSGAMYRAVTLYFLENQIALADKAAVLQALEEIHIEFRFDRESGKASTCLNGENVESEIRQMKVSEKVSAVSTIKEVREKLVAIQKKLGEHKGVVMDGRDIGTVVFPKAELKIFLKADVSVRAERRKKELQGKGMEVPIDQVIENLKERDRIDSTRAVSPLKKAEDAIELDTSNITFENQVLRVIELAHERSGSVV